MLRLSFPQIFLSIALGLSDDIVFLLIFLIAVSFPLMEIMKGMNELVSEMRFIIWESSLLGAKRSCLDVLDFELDIFSRNGRDVNVKVGFHLLILLKILIE